VSVRHERNGEVSVRVERAITGPWDKGWFHWAQGCCLMLHRNISVRPPVVGPPSTIKRKSTSLTFSE